MTHTFSGVKTGFFWCKLGWLGVAWVTAVLSGCSIASEVTSDPDGINSFQIRLGSVLALQGQEEALGNEMKLGLEAALADQTVKGRAIELVFKNDFYEPPYAVEATQALVDEGIFLMLGNVGTPTAKVTLPVLADHGIPAVGFFTGAGILREEAIGPIVNYRASYAQEIRAVVRMAIAAGLSPPEICAYVQDDSYGMSGLAGLEKALAAAGASETLLATYDRILQNSNSRNNRGPVGVYTRNTPDVTPGYESLKRWEAETGTACQFVVTAGSYSNIARFVQLSRQQGEQWVVSALSFTGADNLQLDLEEYGTTEKVVMTQVVPLIGSNLSIVQEAKKRLGDRLGYVSLEGYIVGRMTLEILNQVPGELTRESFMNQVNQTKFSLGGIYIDFTKNPNQGSDLVVVSYLTPEGFEYLSPSQLKTLLRSF